MKRFALLAVLCLVVLSACDKEPETPPPPPPPPPPTAEALESRVMEKVKPLINPFPNGGQELRETMSKEVASLKTELNGGSAQNRITNQFIDLLKVANEAEQWDLVLNLCGAVEVLDPGNTRVQRLRQVALDEKSRPVVQMKGIMEVDGVTNVFLDIYLPDTGKTEHEQVREGEEFHGLLLERIIGNNQGVRLKYLKTDKTFDVNK